MGVRPPGPPPVEPASPRLPMRRPWPADRLLSYDRQLHSWPDGFQVNPKLERQLARRGRVAGQRRRHRLGPCRVAGLRFPGGRGHAHPPLRAGLRPGHLQPAAPHPDGRGDGGSAHAAPGAEGGEGAVRGLQQPLSEAGVLGFEYGYSIATPESLVLWEAQFGDFVNAAQVILDQFLAAGRAKWGQESRLVLLLPHGYEGQGPEHSSARLERFLQLAAEDNIRVANCTTPAQYFHLLRRQALLEEIRPLVVFTPKSLLRHPEGRVHGCRSWPRASSGWSSMTRRPPAAPDQVRRVVLCSGKVYYDLMAEAPGGRPRTWPWSGWSSSTRSRRRSCARCWNATPRPSELVWVQEEPANMGAWTYIRPLPRGAGRRSPRPSATWAGPNGPARPKATRRPTTTSRPGSSARRSARRARGAPVGEPPGRRRVRPRGRRKEGGGRWTHTGRALVPWRAMDQLVVVPHPNPITLEARSLRHTAGARGRRGPGLLLRWAPDRPERGGGRRHRDDPVAAVRTGVRGARGARGRGRQHRWPDLPGPARDEDESGRDRGRPGAVAGQRASPARRGRRRRFRRERRTALRPAPHRQRDPSGNGPPSPRRGRPGTPGRCWTTS
jgi:hypothetical protein